MAHRNEITVEVVYALPQEQQLARVTLPRDATVEAAIRQSGLLQRHPEIDRHPISAGVFGHRVALDAPLKHGDRVEIYRALTVDPKEARRRRAALRADGRRGSQ